MHHPWRALAALTGWLLVWVEFSDQRRAETSWADRTISLDRRLLQAQRRSVLTHELIHVERGPSVDLYWYKQREEIVVDQEASRLLVGIRELGEALAWSSDLDEVAEELWVDRHTLDVRLAHLHPAERHYLRRRLGDEVG